MPIQARAVRYEGAGGPEVIKLGELEVRDPGVGEVRVQVVGAGLNRADLLQRMGVYPAPPGVPADVPGLEFAGVVEAVGPGVTAWKEGSRVMGIAGGGAMATHLVAHEGELVPVPEGLELTEAAAIPEAFATAHDALFLQGGLAMGETALIHAIGSGVGTAALQLCLAAGVRVIGTSRKQEKLERCAGMGLAHGICTDEGSFAKAVAALPVAAPRVVLDTVGAKYIVENLKAVAPGGHIVTIGLLGGVKGELPLGLLVAKRVHWLGSVLRSRGLAEKIKLARAFAAQVVPLFESGALKPVVEAVMPMDQTAAAHEKLASNDVFGKLVLAW